MKFEPKIDKFVFSEIKPSLKLSDDQQTEFLRNKLLRIELLEVEDLDPSDLCVVVTTSAIDTITTPIYFYKHRGDFKFQNGKYILDTKAIDGFLIPVGGRILNIKVHGAPGVNKFKVTMYYQAYANAEDIK